MIIKRNNTALIESSLMIAITVILGLVTIYLPLLGIFVEFFFAVPIAVLTVRHGAGKGLIAMFVSFVLLSMLISPPISFRLNCSVGLCGIALGYGIRKNFDAIRVFFLTLIVASAAQVVTIAVLSLALGVDLIGTQIQVLRESFDESFKFYESMGVDKTLIDETQSNTEVGLKVLAMLIPTLFMLAALINAAAVYLSSKWIFPKLNMKMPQMPPFAQWRFPSLFFYTTIVGGLGLYWGITRSWTGIYEIALNVLAVSLIVGLIQGFSLASALADYFKLSKIFRVVLCMILILSPFMWQVTAVFGLADMIFDYRKKLLSDGR